MSCTEFELFATVLTQTTIQDFIERCRRYNDCSLCVEILFPVSWIQNVNSHFECWERLKSRLVAEWGSCFKLEFSDAKCYQNKVGLNYRMRVQSNIHGTQVLKQEYTEIPYTIDPPTAATLFLKGYLYAGGTLANFPKECVQGTGTVMGYPIYEDRQTNGIPYVFIVRNLIKGLSPFQIWSELRKISGNEIILNYMNHLDNNLALVLYELLHGESFLGAIQEAETLQQKLLIAGVAAIKFKPNLPEINTDYIYQLVTAHNRMCH